MRFFRIVHLTFLFGFVIIANCYEFGSRLERQAKSFEFTGSVFVTSVANPCLCVTRDISGGNQSLRMILEDYCATRKKSRYSRNYTPKLEIAKIAGSDDYQLSQAWREKGKPYGLAGCLTPDNSGIVGSDCNSNNSFWNIVRLGSADQIQLVHKNTGKCIRSNNVGKGITLVKCNRNDVEQQWSVKIEKD